MTVPLIVGVLGWWSFGSLILILAVTLWVLVNGKPADGETET